MSTPKRVVISWSSGKDSTLTLERLQEDPNYEVVGLYTTYVDDEVPFQATPLEVVQMQADLLGLPLITIELPAVFPSNDIYQSTIVTALAESKLNIQAVAFGDMFCNGIADYRRSYIESAGWECVFSIRRAAKRWRWKSLIAVFKRCLSPLMEKSCHQIGAGVGMTNRWLIRYQVILTLVEKMVSFIPW